MEEALRRRDADYSAGLLIEARARRSGFVSMLHFSAMAQKGTTLCAISQEVRM